MRRHWIVGLVVSLASLRPAACQGIWLPVGEAQMTAVGPDGGGGVCTYEQLVTGGGNLVHYPGNGGPPEIVQSDDTRYAFACLETQVLLFVGTNFERLLWKRYGGQFREVIAPNARISRVSEGGDKTTTEYIKSVQNVVNTTSMPGRDSELILQLRLGPNEADENGAFLAWVKFRPEAPNTPLATLLVGGFPDKFSTDPFAKPNDVKLLLYSQPSCATAQTLATTVRVLLTTTGGFQLSRRIVRVFDPLRPIVDGAVNLFGDLVTCTTDTTWIEYIDANGIYKVDAYRDGVVGPVTRDLVKLGVTSPTPETRVEPTDNGHLYVSHQGSILEVFDDRPPVTVRGNFAMNAFVRSRNRLWVMDPFNGRRRLTALMVPSIGSAIPSGRPGDRIRIVCQDCAAALGTPTVEMDGKPVDARVEDSRGYQTTLSFVIPPEAKPSSLWQITVGSTGIKVPFSVPVVLAVPAVLTQVSPGTTLSADANAMFAPGGLFILAGTNLTGVRNSSSDLTGVNVSDGRPWSKELAKARVLVDGKPVPLQRAITVAASGSSEVRGQLPMDLPPGTHVVTVERLPGSDGTPGAATNGLSITVASTAPVLLGGPDFVRLDGGLVGQDAPAISGETLTVLGTGFGLTDPAIPEGSAAGDLAPQEVKLAATVQVWVRAKVGSNDDYREAQVMTVVPSPKDPGMVSVTFVMPDTSGIDPGEGGQTIAWVIVKVGDAYAAEAPFFVR